VAFLLLDQLPEGVAPVILGSALHNEDHRYRPACRAAQDDRHRFQLGCQSEMRIAWSGLYPSFRSVGAEGGTRHALFAGVRPCPSCACNGPFLSVVCCSFLLMFAGVAVRVAVQANAGQQDKLLLVPLFGLCSDRRNCCDDRNKSRNMLSIGLCWQLRQSGTKSRFDNNSRALPRPFFERIASVASTTIPEVVQQ
jgi:hypothetical protein